MLIPIRRSALLLVIAFAGCRAGAPGTTGAPDALGNAARLPTGRALDPAGTSHPLGALPLAILRAPDSGYVVVLSGFNEQGIQVLNNDGTVRQTVLQPAAFLGAVFSPDGKTLYVSGGNQDVVYRYQWSAGRATLADSLVLAAKKPKEAGQRYPAGIALSPDGRFLYVAENLADSLAVFEVATGRILRRLPTGRYPYGVVVAPNGNVFVSQWNGSAVLVFDGWGGTMEQVATVPAGRHPSALLLNPEGTRLFVASASTDRVTVIDATSYTRLGELRDPPPEGPEEGSTPNGLSLSVDGTRLFVAEGDANAVAVFDLSARFSGVVNATGNDLLAGRIPTEWYPTATFATGDTLLVMNGKGKGTRANPDGPGPRLSEEFKGSAKNSTQAQVSGSVTLSLTARLDRAGLAPLSARVARANLWNAPPSARKRYPPIEHVVYIIKENRTYDQVLGDLRQADGDTSLVYFGRANSPNQHALAERFGIYDRFFVNAEVSPDGHNWSMAAYTSDYLQKTLPSNYSSRGRTYDYEGTNRGWGPDHEIDDDVNEPASGYLWDLANRKGITFRNYGEFVIGEGMDRDKLPAGYTGLKPFLKSHTNTKFPAYDLGIPDQQRADIWLEEFAEHVRTGVMPQLEIVRLPNDHTQGLRANAPSPRAMMADNDLALGRIITALSHSPFWRNTAVFVLEDDAQNGPDHVDSHRSPMLVISPWAAGGVLHRYTNTTDVLRTIEELLGLDALSQFDHYGRPLREIWRNSPDVTPYDVLTPGVPLMEKNPARGAGATASAKLELDVEDRADEDAFNRILWLAAKGPARRYPGIHRMSLLEGIRSR
ncbi:MAG: bifunctional YncE family protein/alkaline phosphatase family protein [Gemmatimonadales bacterium]